MLTNLFVDCLTMMTIGLTMGWVGLGRNFLIKWWVGWVGSEKSWVGFWKLDPRPCLIGPRNILAIGKHLAYHMVVTLVPLTLNTCSVVSTVTW